MAGGLRLLFLLFQFFDLPVAVLCPAYPRDFIGLAQALQVSFQSGQGYLELSCQIFFADCRFCDYCLQQSAVSLSEFSLGATLGLRLYEFSRVTSLPGLPLVFSVFPRHVLLCGAGGGIGFGHQQTGAEDGVDVLLLHVIFPGDFEV